MYLYVPRISSNGNLHDLPIFLLGFTQPWQTLGSQEIGKSYHNHATLQTATCSEVPTGGVEDFGVLRFTNIQKNVGAK